MGSLGAARARPIRVAIVDDHPIVRAGTAALLAECPDMVCIGAAGSLAEGRRFLQPSSCDALLLDLRVGDASGFDFLADSRSHDKPAIVVLTSYDFPQYAEQAQRLGVLGFVLKTAPAAELFEAIRRALAGKVTFDVAPAPSLPLTARERQIIGAVVEGLSNAEIGARLAISHKTVEAHLRRLFDRTGAMSRTELAVRAVCDGWVRGFDALSGSGTV